jgi:hypothetical protein
LWIEKVLLRTTAAAGSRVPDDREGALGGLLRTIRDLEAGAAPLASLAEDFADLKRKLPAELFAESEMLDPTDPERLRGLLGEVEDLLLARLLASPEGAEA